MMLSFCVRPWAYPSISVPVLSDSSILRSPAVQNPFHCILQHAEYVLCHCTMLSPTLPSKALGKALTKLWLETFESSSGKGI